MSSIIFTIPGKPAGKARPRFVKKTGIAFSPDPGNFQARVQLFASEAGCRPQEGAVRLRIQIHRRMPKSWSKRKSALAKGQPAMGKPDTGNILLAICDGLQGAAYHDDLQVTSFSVHRLWDDEDKTVIRVSPDTQPNSI
jgi:Holliday junction resolvase RusA-like endonuclease